MPHLIVEYSRDLDFPVQPTLHSLHQVLAASGVFDAKDIKVRSREYSDYLVSGGREQGFVHLILFLLDGRSDDTKTALGQALASVMRQATAGHSVQISVDIRDIVRHTYTKFQD